MKTLLIFSADKEPLSRSVLLVQLYSENEELTLDRPGILSYEHIRHVILMGHEITFIPLSILFLQKRIKKVNVFFHWCWCNVFPTFRKL